MHRLPPKGEAPGYLLVFCRDNPQCKDWDFFRNNYPTTYGKLKKLVFEQQEYLCAYCEDKLPAADKSSLRIEHFHPKSHDDSEHNWTFDWENMLGCCMGGSTDRIPADSDEKKASTLHCDAHKETCKTQNYFNGDLLNPLTMPFECLFDIDRATGELKPNETMCAKVSVPNNIYGSVSQLVSATIRILNLNCTSLNEKRLLVIGEFERKRRLKRQNPRANKKSIRTEIAREWFEGRSPSFYTTRRILLGDYAEQFILQRGTW